MTKVGLLARLEAKPGRETEVAKYLEEKALPLAQDEPATTAWFAVRLGPSTFGVFHAFPDEMGRNAHVAGKMVAALTERVPELLTQSPTIERFDIIALKLPQ
jgi:quinol monooxygenase YgiN